MQWLIDILIDLVSDSAEALKTWVLDKNYTTLAEVKAYSGKARAHSSSNQAIPTGTWTKVTLDVEDYDTNDRFASSKFVAHHGGHYQFNLTLLLEAPVGNTIFIAALYKNGVAYSKGRVHASFGSSVSAVVSDVVRLEAGNYVEAWCYHSSGINKSIIADTAYSYMSVGEIV